MVIAKLKAITGRVLNLVNKDFCPSLNKYVYWLKKPIVVVVLAILFSLSVGLLVGPQGFILAVGLMGLLLLGLFWPWLSMFGVRCQLELPDRQFWENEEVPLTFRVKNFWPLPIFGMIVEGDFLQDLEQDEERVAFSLTKVPAWSETEFQVRVTPRQRGRFPSGDVFVKNGFPFGLIDITKPIATTKSVLVWPACQSLDGHPPAEGTRFNVLGALKDQSGSEGETIGVRTFREGDRLRNVHWAQTVRAQRLMVREQQSLCSTAATVYLDLALGHHVGFGIDSSYEWAIRIAGSVCYQLHNSRSPVRLQCVGLPEAVPAIDNNYGINKLMNGLASLPKRDEIAESELSPPCLENRRRPRFNSGRVFFVGTCRSTIQSEVNEKNLESIIIKLDEFRSANDESTEVEKNVFSGGIVVSSPELAASQFSEQWKRNVSSVAS